MGEPRKYVYKGPVVRFGRVIAESWTGETSAVSEKKAMTNLEYQFKKYAGLAANVNVGLYIKNLKLVEENVNDK